MSRTICLASLFWCLAAAAEEPKVLDDIRLTYRDATELRIPVTNARLASIRGTLACFDSYQRSPALYEVKEETVTKLRFPVEGTFFDGTFSADGKLYAGGEGQLVVLDRDQLLTKEEDLVVPMEGESEFESLKYNDKTLPIFSPQRVTISPRGGFVFVADTNPATFLIYSRHLKTGKLSLLQAWQESRKEFDSRPNTRGLSLMPAAEYAAHLQNIRQIIATDDSVYVVTAFGVLTFQFDTRERTWELVADFSGPSVRDVSAAKLSGSRLLVGGLRSVAWLDADEGKLKCVAALSEVFDGERASSELAVAAGMKPVAGIRDCRSFEVCGKYLFCASAHHKQVTVIDSKGAIVGIVPPLAKTDGSLAIPRAVTVVGKFLYCSYDACLLAQYSLGDRYWRE